MDTRTEPIKQDIDSIRDSMTDKMEQIEARIKGTVDDTTETLKRSLDVKLQVQEHPWAALGVALLAGYALGSMGGSDRSTPSTYRYRDDFRHDDYRSGEAVRYYGDEQKRDEQRSNQNTQSRNDYSTRQDYSSRNDQPSQAKGFFDDVMDNLGIEMDTLKAAAISSLVGMVRDTVKQNLPGVYNEAERLRTDSQSYNTRSSSYATGTNESAYVPAGGGAYGNGSSSYGTQSNNSSNNSSPSYTTPKRTGTPSNSQINNGEGEFYREADITEGNTPTYNRMSEIYPAGSSEPDKPDNISTQQEVGENPNYDMIPPARHANPDGRP